uniref:Vomeronasal type-1 receptor n=1 Tax=Ursus maritimus TaxID=29073 RepID=A0A452TBP2_URSMA
MSVFVNLRLVFSWSISGAMFIGLMVWCSGSMVLLLHGHHQRTRATRTILMLVTTFVVFYMRNSIFAFYVITLIGSYLCILDAYFLCFGFMFPTICPLLLILRDSIAPNFCF